MVNYMYLPQLPAKILLFCRTQWKLKKSREWFWTLGTKLQADVLMVMACGTRDAQLSKQKSKLRWNTLVVLFWSRWKSRMLPWTMVLVYSSHIKALPNSVLFSLIRQFFKHLIWEHCFYLCEHSFVQYQLPFLAFCVFFCCCCCFSWKYREMPYDLVCR